VSLPAIICRLIENCHLTGVNPPLMLGAASLNRYPSPTRVARGKFSTLRSCQMLCGHCERSAARATIPSLLASVYAIRLLRIEHRTPHDRHLGRHLRDVVRSAARNAITGDQLVRGGRRLDLAQLLTFAERAPCTHLRSGLSCAGPHARGGNLREPRAGDVRAAQLPQQHRSDFRCSPDAVCRVEVYASAEGC
jgi:hypothetical protein